MPRSYAAAAGAGGQGPQKPRDAKAEEKRAEAKGKSEPEAEKKGRAPAADADVMEVEDVTEDQGKGSNSNQPGNGAVEIMGLGPSLTPVKKSKSSEKAAAGSSSGESVSQSRWHIIYPVYINAQRTLAEGRRIPKARAVDMPTLQEMCDSCTFLKLPVLPEPDKAYPRDYLWSPDRGRIRVQIKDSRGLPLNPEIPSKMALMLKLGSLIPKHHGRNRKDGGPPKKDQSDKGPTEKEKKSKGKKKR